MLQQVDEPAVPRGAKELGRQCGNRAAAGALARHAGRVAVSAKGKPPLEEHVVVRNGMH